jgi:3-phosphoshikimate 1-carboxyvinyltransferase
MTVSTTSRVIIPGGALRGELRPPPDKSITHRAVILSALATGPSRIVHPLEADDCRRTAEAFRSLGVLVETDGRNDWIVVGHGSYGLKAPEDGTIYCGNSGTTMRLLSGVLAGQPFETKLMGDHSLSQRPMARIVEPLTKMGAGISARDGKYAPLHIRGRRPLQGLSWNSSVASAQVKSCLLLAGLYAEGVTTIREPERSRDHSERMLAAAGVKLTIGEKSVSLTGGQTLNAMEWVVPSDISSAAFFIIGALLLHGSELMLRNVNVNPTRDGVLEVLRTMGADVRLEDMRSVAGEPLADIVVKASSLKGVSIGAAVMPRLIDEVPVLAVAATQAQGVTEITGAQELRVKESDRLKLMADQLNKMGAEIEELPDGLRIEGPTPLKGARVDSHTDHRLAMSFAIAGLAARGETTILNADAVDISFPSFWSDLEKLRVAS